MAMTVVAVIPVLPLLLILACAQSGHSTATASASTSASTSAGASTSASAHTSTDSAASAPVGVGTSWDAKTAYRMQSNGRLRPLLTDVTSPAGVAYDTRHETLAVTSMQDNKLYLLPLR
jgi:hypothetical protein